MATCLWHASHPFQLRTVQIVGTRHFSTTIVDTLLTFLQIIGIVTTVGVDGLVVQFKNNGAHTIQKETIMRYH